MLKKQIYKNFKDKLILEISSFILDDKDYSNNEVERKLTEYQRYRIDHLAVLDMKNRLIINNLHKYKLSMKDILNNESYLFINRHSENSSVYSVYTHDENPNEFLSRWQPFYNISYFDHNQALKIKPHTLKLGDIFKIGKYIFRVRMMRTTKSLLESYSQFLEFEKRNCYKCSASCFCHPLDMTPSTTSINLNQMTNCQFCYKIIHFTGYMAKAIIKACKCPDQLGVVHFDCLKKEINENCVEIRNKCLTTFSVEELNCKQCFHPFSSQFVYFNKLFRIIEIKKPTYPFILLENLNPDKGLGNYIKDLYLIEFHDTNIIHFGSELKCEVKLNQGHFSTVFSSIELRYGYFILKCHQQEYPTVVKFTKTMKLTKDIMNIYVNNMLYECKFVKKYLKK